MTTDSPTPSSLQWVSIAQAADLLSVSTKTIRRRIADGTLAAKRIGARTIRIHVDALDGLGRPLTPSRDR